MNKILFILLAILLSSCFENVVDSTETRFSNTLDLITYAETRTNLFNEEDSPQLVTVDELNQNIGNYHIIDIRDEFQYQSGHVSNAVNLKMKDLLNYLKELDTFKFQKVVIISSTGQLASYATCLVNLAGFTNVYPLDRGMTFWNQMFSNELRNAQSDVVRFVRYQPSTINSTVYSPPIVFYKNYPKTMQEKIEDRIQQLLNSSPLDIFILAENFDALFTIRPGRYDNSFVIYSIHNSIYFEGPFPPNHKGTNILGPVSANKYDTQIDFTSNKHLFNIPTHRDIILYSPNGQRSAYYTAYLQLVGYKATTIKYGFISMSNKKFYYRTAYFDFHYKTGELIDTVYIVSEIYLTPYGFEDKWIRDYSYEVGE